MRRLRTVLFGVVLLSLILLGAEAGSRVDDWIFSDVPFFANPERNRDLTVQDTEGPRGRPHGHFKKWKLNQFGFRGPEIAREPAPGTTRVMILGASETFGLYETEGREYPRQLAEVLQRRGHPEVEVVNTAMAGMTLSSMRPYWRTWASPFHPTVVLIYPSPLLYLDDELPGKWTVAPSDPEAERAPRFESRFLGRVRDDLRRNAWLRRQRVRLLLALHPNQADNAFQGLPQDRLDAFQSDLVELLTAIRAGGAEPVVVTHAHRATSPPRPEDSPDLQAMQLFYPRAAPDLLVTFEQAANQVVVDVGKEQQVRVIDTAALNGHREWFADLVHFNDDGAAHLAEIIAQDLIPILPHE
jgi:lysophospholipase L1-like esterase